MLKKKVAKREEECWVNIPPRQNKSLLNIYFRSSVPFNHSSNRITSVRHNVWFPLFCVFRTLVNIIYILCHLPRALITLTGSFNWINYPQTAPTSALALTGKHTNKTESFLICFPASSNQSAIFQWFYILMNVYQLVLPKPFNTKGGAPPDTQELLLSCCCYPSIWNSKL